MSNNQRRLFIGLELTSDAKLQIHNWREKHLAYLPGKPVPMDNFHITLSFLGHVPDSKLETLDLLMQGISSSSITTSTSILGTFLKPQVLYLGVNKTEALQSLAKQCRGINNKLSIPQQHSEYRPHISLYRKHNANVAIDVKLLEMTLNFGHFHLFESVSNATFGKSPKYVKQLSYPLK